MAKTPAPATPGVVQTPAEFSGNVLFYGKPEPLSRETHAKIGLRRMDKPFGFASTSNVVPLTVAEFPMAGLSYPIIFAGERYQPLAVMGVGQGQNLYIQADGSYELGAYIPAYIRRYPFVLATDQTRGQLVVCIDRNASMLGEDYDLAFFDEKGEATDYTNGCIQFCNDFETEGRRTESFVNLLKELDLFEVKRSTFTPPNPDGTPGQPQPIAEYFAISEDKVKALPADKLQELTANGALGQIYAHMMSLGGWDRLIALALSRAPQPAAANVN
jgi:hypothetical protein